MQQGSHYVLGPAISAKGLWFNGLSGRGSGVQHSQQRDPMAR